MGVCLNETDGLYPGTGVEGQISKIVSLFLIISGKFT